MGGLSPETWPVLAAFLLLQTLITLPLIKYIRAAHEAQVGLQQRLYEAQIAALQKVYEAATAERSALLKQVEATTESMWKFTAVLEELRASIKDLTRERRGP